MQCDYICQAIKIEKMLFTTQAGLPTNEFAIGHREQIMLVGSCFASNIGNKLKERKFRLELNPFGVQYNPLSIAEVLKRVATGEPFKESSPELFFHNGMWHSCMHHSDFSRESKEEIVNCINSRLATAHDASFECSTVIVTFGTAYAYYRNSDNTVVGNCHKLPGNMFTRKLLDIDTIVETFSRIIELYKRRNAGTKFLFTVSPIRHLRDGAHDNQKSKATLILAIERIMQLYPDDTFYFPAYEIVLDELRDYRFYAEDMVHPSATAIEYIWECFGKCYFNSKTEETNKEIEEIARALGHRPFNASSDSYKKFISGTLRRIAELEEKMPYLDFEKEKEQCNTLLKR